MNLYDVHLYTTVRVKLSGVQAPSMEEAIDIAQQNVDLHELFDADPVKHNGYYRIEKEWAEEDPNYSLVDVYNKDHTMDYGNSTWFGPHKEKGLAGIEDLFYKILDKKELLPVLMGIDENLDKMIADRLKED